MKKWMIVLASVAALAVALWQLKKADQQQPMVEDFGIQ